jgi:hypothetical protein
MAYQTMPNTFVSGGTIYSTAVSANMVALLQGYTSGSYDGWFRDMKASGGVEVGGGVATITSGGGVYGQSLNMVGTAAVGATLTVGGALSVTGDVYSTAWTSYTPVITGGGGMSVSAFSASYRTIGKMVFVQMGLRGRMSADGSVTVDLPATASSVYPVYGSGTPCLEIVSAGVGNDVPGVAQPVPGSNNVILWKGAGSQTFTSSVTYNIGGKFWYERE